MPLSIGNGTELNSRGKVLQNFQKIATLKYVLNQTIRTKTLLDNEMLIALHTTNFKISNSKYLTVLYSVGLTSLMS